MPRRGQRERGIAQRARAVALRESGASYAQIGEALGVCKQMAHRYVQSAMADLTMRTSEAAERIRQLELLRLDALVRAHWPRRAEVPHARILLDVSRRRAMLEGLDMPAKIETTAKDGAPFAAALAEDQLDLDVLTDEELLSLERIIAKASRGTPGSGPGT